MKNLLVNGCSFTDDSGCVLTWATFLKEIVRPEQYINLASGGAGNEYICKSTINFLETTHLDPEQTLIVIMWSGTGRKDLTVSGEWWYHLKNDYYYLAKATNEEYYLFSGGLTNSWLDNSFTKNTFSPLYKLSDPLSLSLDSLYHFNVLKNYLENKKYQFKFTSYFDYWSSDIESVHDTGDYSIGWFCKDHPVYKNFDFSNWICIDNSLGNFAKSLDELDQTVHPTTAAHSKFTTDILVHQLDY